MARVALVRVSPAVASLRADRRGAKGGTYEHGAARPHGVSVRVTFGAILLVRAARKRPLRKDGR